MKTGQLNIMLLLSAFFVLFSNPIFAQQHLRSRVSWVEVVEDPQDVQQEPVRTYYSYDAHGNVKALLQQLPGMPAKRTDYVYDLVSGNVNMVIYQYGASDQMIQKYRYDADNRLQQVHTSTDGYVWNKEAMYKYYAHGPLSRIELGQHRVQGLDYYYTLQGWLKGVNGANDANDPGQDGMGISRVSKDAFAFALGYFEGDYQGIAQTPTTNQLWTRLDEQYSQDPPNPYKGLYNGNIAWMQTDLPGLQDKPEQAMLYRYDQLNRLVLARGLNQYDASSGFAARSGSTGPYDASYTYDPNGNLLSLDRHKQDGSLLDEFDYSYTANTNRLASVEDASLETITYDEKIYDNGPIRHDGNVYRSIIAKDNATAEAGQTAQLLQANESITLQPSFHAKAGSGFHAKWTNASNTEDEVSDFAYEYDAIGNLTHDRGEGTDITWTPYGKVRTVSKGDGTAISYQHDAAGNRISKRVTSNNQTKTTHYVRDASGNVLSIYQDEALQEQPIYGSSRLGMYRPTASKADGSLLLGQRNYELSNHLGNVLSVITDEVKINTDGLHEPVILQTQDYRPFGLAMEGRSWQSESYKYRYGFNGKEKDKDFQNNYDYGFRIYNPRIGKFLSVDPLTSGYASWSPYPFAMGRPIDGVDLDGLEYLDADEARIEFKYGGLQLKVENFLWINRRVWSAANADPKNWKTGEIGLSRKLGSVEFIRPTQKSELASMDNTYGATDPAYDPTQHRTSGRLTKQSGYTESDKRYKNGSSSRTLSGASRLTGPTGKGALLLNTINTLAEQYISLSYIYDEGKVKEHTKFANLAVEDTKQALRDGLIPGQYQNTEGLTNIMNVVLTGVNNTDDENIYNIGMKIYNNISRPVEAVTPGSPAGADNTRVNRTYIVPKTSEQ